MSRSSKKESSGENHDNDDIITASIYWYTKRLTMSIIVLFSITILRYYGNVAHPYFCANEMASFPLRWHKINYIYVS